MKYVQFANNSRKYKTSLPTVMWELGRVAAKSLPDQKSPAGWFDNDDVSIRHQMVNVICSCASS